MRITSPLAAAALLTLGAPEVDVLTRAEAMTPTRTPLLRGGRFDSLTGLWRGQYEYPVAIWGVRSVPFNARIEDVAGAISGQTDEPNALRLGGSTLVTARVSGHRAGLNVSFVKQMDGSGGMTHSIQYQGVVNDSFTRITGTWAIPREWSGRFFMERADVVAEASAENRTARAT